MGAYELVSQSLMRFADFGGRASRAEYWTFVTIVLVAQAAARLGDAMLGDGAFVTGPIALATGGLLFVPAVSVTLRRLHDIDRSSRDLVIPCFLTLAAPLTLLLGSDVRRVLAIVYGAVTAAMIGRLLVLLARKGSSAANPYGENPAFPAFGR